MNSLLLSTHVAYDANCLIYFCMHSEIIDGENKVVVVFPDLTDKIREITDRLVAKGKGIKTIELIYEEVARSDRAGLVVNRLANSDEVRRQLGLARGEKFPSIIKFRIIKSLDKKVRSLKGKGWLEIVSFEAPGEDLEKVRNFYRSLSNDPQMIEIMRRKNRPHSCPSAEDMHLLLFSAKSAIPVVSNDNELVLFKDGLVSNGLCHRVVPLGEIVLDDPS